MHQTLYEHLYCKRNAHIYRVHQLEIICLFTAQVLIINLSRRRDMEVAPAFHYLQSTAPHHTQYSRPLVQRSRHCDTVHTRVYILLSCTSVIKMKVIFVDLYNDNLIQIKCRKMYYIDFSVIAGISGFSLY